MELEHGRRRTLRVDGEAKRNPLRRVPRELHGPELEIELLTVHDTKAIDPSVIEEERAAGMPDALIRQEYLCDFSAALVGSVWGDLIERLEKEGQLEPFEHGTDELYSSFDLGVSDATSLLVWRINREKGLLPGIGVDFLDHYSSNGRPLSHYLDWIEEREQKHGWRFAKHWLPADGRARTLQTGVSTEDLFRERYPGKVQIGPSLSLADGIQAGRWLLQQNVRFHPRCAAGIESLRQYHYEFDEDRKTYSSKPEHDWSSHDADAFRYAACVVRHVESITRLEAPPRPHTPVQAEPWTLDGLFEQYDEDNQNDRERI